MEGLSLIDVSAEDDLLYDFASPSPAPPRPDPPRAGSLVSAEATSSVGSPSAAGKAADPDGGMVEQAAPERTESPEQRKAKKGVNLRKSLAWDSAFFTSEGVLDTEELGIVNSTFRKTQGSRLPGIVEEMRKSEESTASTLESESWAMESLETELFDNVRASIQRSLGKPDKVPGRAVAGSNTLKATANVPRVAAKKGVDRMPQPKIRAPVSTSQGAGGRQRPQLTTKEPVAARVNLPGAAEAKISSKPPRALPRVAMMRSSTNIAVTSGISDKRSSTGGAVNRQAAGKTASTSAGLRSSGGTKPCSISKSGPITSATTSSHGVSMDTKPEAKARSATLGNKNRTAQRVPVRPPSKPGNSKTLPSRSTGNKIPAKGHADRSSPSISPSSSMDSMSSVISGASTTSTLGRMSHTSESLNALSPSLRKSNDCPPTPKPRPPIVTDGHSSGTAAGDNLKATAETINKGKGFKPSGLRRPTPKIGYFDPEKHIDQNIGQQVQPQPSKIPCLPGTPKTQNMNVNAALSTYGQPESKLAAARHDKICASKSVVRPLPLMVEVEPFKVAEPACTNLTDPVVARPEVEKCTDQNIGAQVQQQPSKILCLPGTPKYQNMDVNATQEPACTNLTDAVVSRPEAAQPQSTEIHCLLATTPNSHPTFGQKVLKPIAAPHEVSACKSNTVKAPLEAVKLEVEAVPMEVDTPEVCRHLARPGVVNPKDKSLDQNAGGLLQTQLAAEPETCTHKTETVVGTDCSKENIPSLHQNIQANVDASSLLDLLTEKLSSISLGEATPDVAPSSCRE